MYFVLANDFLVKGYCKRCKSDTKWIVIFEAIHFGQNTVTFITECTECITKNKNLKGYRCKINFEDWLGMLPYSSIEDN